MPLRDRLGVVWPALLLIWSTHSLSAQDNWTRFRGPHASGVAEDDARLPDTWDREQHVGWVSEIPGWGWGSPIVWGDRVFVSAVHSDDEYEKPKGGLYLGGGRGEPPDSVHHWMVYCLDFTTGDILWRREAHTGKPQIPRHPKNTYAAETPTTDGKRLYVLFGDVGLYCYDFEGRQQWVHPIEAKKTLMGYGAAASPIVHDGLVILTYDNEEDSYIMALDAASGEVRWRTARDETSTWATPLIWEHEGRTEIVQPGRKANRAYSLDGKLLWHFDGKMSVLTIPSPFVVDGLLYVTSGYFQDPKRPVFAIRPGASGDITLGDDENANEFIAWSVQKMGPYNTSPIVVGGRYYTLLDRGMLTCHDAKTGAIIFDRTRFPQGASFTASPWAYNGRLFFLSEDGRTFVVRAGNEVTGNADQPTMIVERINDLDELCIATPAVAQGKLLVRTASKIYCITNAP